MRYPAGTDINTQVRVEYDATLAPRTVGLDGSYVDARGVAYSGSVVLYSFASVVSMRP